MSERSAMARWRQAHRAVSALYLLFGIVVIAWVPRMPEIKAQLGLGVGDFGLLLSLGTAGSLAGTLVMGHLISRVGSKPVVTTVLLTQLLVMTLLTHVRSPLLFGLGFVVFVACGATTALALNAQGTQLRDLLGREILGRMHGLWSVGALGSGVLASAVADYIPLTWHILIVSLLLAPMVLHFARSILTRDEESELAPDLLPRFDAVLRPSRRTLLLALALSSGALIEYASGDWAAIYARESIGVALSASGLAFTSMMLGLTAGRFVIDQLTARHGSVRTIRGSALLIVVGILLLSPLSTLLLSATPAIALMTTYIGFAIAGMGTAGIVPLFISAAARSTDLPRSVVLAQMAVLQAGMVWVYKAVIAVLADATSIAIGLLWPAATALITIALAGLTHDQRSTKTDDQSRNEWSDSNRGK